MTLSEIMHHLLVYGLLPGMVVGFIIAVLHEVWKINKRKEND